MDNFSTEYQRIIAITEKLIDSNKHLAEVNASALKLVANSQQTERGLLAHCGKIYKYLNSKNTKTWEEEEIINTLYQLITHSLIAEGSGEV